MFPTPSCSSLSSPTMEATYSCSSWLLLLSLAIIAPWLFFLFRHGGTSRHLPPGPPIVLVLAKSLPLLAGSLSDLSALLRTLHVRYGPIISIRLIFRTFIFVADAGLAQRMLIQSGSTFATRPPTFEPRHLFTSGEITFSPYGHYWRLVRRNLATVELSPARTRQLAPVMRSTCDGLLHELRRAATCCCSGNDMPAEAVVVLRPLLRSAMFKLLVHRCFGVHLGQEAVDQIYQLQRQMLHSFSTFPVFSVFPAVTKKLFRNRWAACVAVRQKQEELFIPLIHATLRGIGNDDTPCYARSLLDIRVPEHEDGHGGDRPLTDGEMTSLCSELLNAVVDTTGTLIEWIMAELVNHPDIQAKVYTQVKACSQVDNSTDDNDLPDVPYLKAVVLEGLRQHPPGHFVIPHGMMSDAVVDGYTIPKDAEVNFMVADIGRDSKVWTRPLEFCPERFLEGGEGHDVDIKGIKQIKMMPFSAGRRMCPGYPLAMRMAEYIVARMVMELEWHPPAVGVKVDMAEEFDFTTVMKHPLHARIVLRS